MSAAPPARAAAALSALRATARGGAVCFDVDSTVIDCEAIDALAEAAGAGAAVAALTRAAMGGSMPFREALAARLALIAPSSALLARFSAAHAFRLTPGVAPLIAALRARGAAVFLVSGGFTQMIHPLADVLAVPRERVFANTILFDEAGAYAGFDTAAPTSRDGGKPEVLRALKARGFDPIVMIGDGVTDMQARPPADAFIGYGGVVERQPVVDGACLFVRDFEVLLKALEEGG